MRKRENIVLIWLDAFSIKCKDYNFDLSLIFIFPYIFMMLFYTHAVPTIRFNSYSRHWVYILIRNGLYCDILYWVYLYVVWRFQVIFHWNLGCSALSLLFNMTVFHFWSHNWSQVLEAHCHKLYIPLLTTGIGTIFSFRPHFTPRNIDGFSPIIRTGYRYVCM